MRESVRDAIVDRKSSYVYDPWQPLTPINLA